MEILANGLYPVVVVGACAVALLVLALLPGCFEVLSGDGRTEMA